MTWQQDAACRGRDYLFFQPVGNPDYTEAEALCAACPVLAECKADAREFEIHSVYVHGFRAGQPPEVRIKALKAKGRERTLEQIQRKNEVARLVAGGYSERQIAVILDIAPRSVSRIKTYFLEDVA